MMINYFINNFRSTDTIKRSCREPLVSDEKRKKNNKRKRRRIRSKPCGHFALANRYTMSASGTGGLKVMFRSLILTTLSNFFFQPKKKIGS